MSAERQPSDFTSWVKKLAADTAPMRDAIHPDTLYLPGCKEFFEEKMMRKARKLAGDQMGGATVSIRRARAKSKELPAPSLPVVTYTVDCVT